jgi:hypothetical protein
MPKNNSEALLTSLTPGQERDLLNAVRDELLNVYPPDATDTRDGQRLIRRMGDFKFAAHKIIVEIGGMRYRSERVPSNYGYTLAVKPVCEQLLMLKNYPLFQKLDCSQALNRSKAMVQLPENAEGNFVYPWWGAIGKTYAEATEKVAQELVRVHNMKNWLEKHLTVGHLRQYEHSRLSLEAIRQKQPGDFQVFPAQFGILHRGESVRLVRDILLPKEFGLGPYEVGIMLLTHPERLQRYEDLFVECSGAEYDYNAEGQFPSAPVFLFNVGRPNFAYHLVGHPHVHYGAASAFLP